MTDVLTVTAVRPLADYHLHVAFSDGAQGVVDLTPLLDRPVFAPLRDPSFFANVQLDGWTITWPNGADVAPVRLREWLKVTEAA